MKKKLPVSWQYRLDLAIDVVLFVAVVVAIVSLFVASGFGS